jgi:hypothetical protein
MLSNSSNGRLTRGYAHVITCATHQNLEISMRDSTWILLNSTMEGTSATMDRIKSITISCHKKILDGLIDCSLQFQHQGASGVCSGTIDT